MGLWVLKKIVKVQVQELKRLENQEYQQTQVQLYKQYYQSAQANAR